MPPRRILARLVLAGAALTATVTAPSDALAQRCDPDSAIAFARGPRTRQFVFVGRDLERLDDGALLRDPAIAGVQLTMTWRELEPARDRYDFRALEARVVEAARHGKRIMLQLQDVSFVDRPLVPDYLLQDTSFHGGAVPKIEGDDEATAHAEGWVSRRWDDAVLARYAALLTALGRAFDGRLEGVTIPETAIGFNLPTRWPSGFTFERYVTGVQAMTTAARRAFPRSCIVLYANFMPGEWRPGNDRGYLSAVHAHAWRIGAGVGGPDLMPHRPGQRNHLYALLRTRPAGVVAGVAVQDGNLAERDPATGTPVTVASLAAFARDTLRLDYVFWGIEEPYFSRDVLPFLRAEAAARPRPSRPGATRTTPRP